MPILYILCGPSGSGKTTWAKTDERVSHCAYVSRDEIRYSIVKDDEDYFSHEKEVFKRFISEIIKYMRLGYDTIADATHLNKYSRNKLTSAIDEYMPEYKIIYVVFNTNIDTCLNRNTTRLGRANVPEDAIRNMYNNFYIPTKDEDERIIDIIEVSE